MKGLEEDGLVRQVAEVRPEAMDGCVLGGDGKLRKKAHQILYREENHCGVEIGNQAEVGRFRLGLLGNGLQG